MLSIHFGSTEKEIFNPSIYFNNRHEPEWLTTPLAKEMIRDIDKSEVSGPFLIQSPVLGPIPPEQIRTLFQSYVINHRHSSRPKKEFH